MPSRLNGSIHSRGSESGTITGRRTITGQLHTLPVGSDSYQGVDLTNLVHGENVERIVTISQSDYDALPERDSKTLYVVGG